MMDRHPVGLLARWRILCTGWFLLLLVPVATAQTGSIQGTVQDESGTPLAGVNLVLQGTQLGAATDARGHYEIRRIPVGSYTLVVSAVGFMRVTQRLVVTASSIASFDFILAEETLMTDEVIVTAARREQLTSRVPVSVSVIQPEDIQRRNNLGLDDALRYVPGVQMAENQVNIRGSSGFSFNTGSRVLLLLDGIPLLAPDRESIPYDALPMAQIERVEVVKGPGSALYGGGALGGVINVITKDFPDTPETALTLFAGAYEPVRYDVWRDAWADGDTPRPFGGFTLTHARSAGEKFGFWLNAAYREDEGYTNFHTEKDLDTFFKLGWRPHPSVRLDLLNGWTWRKSDSFLYWNGARDPLNPGQLDFGQIRATGTNDNQINQFSVLPSLTHFIGSSFFYALKGRLFAAIIQPLEDDGTPKPISAGTIGFRYGGEIQLTWSPEEGTFLTAGVTGDALATESSFFKNDEGNTEVRGQPEAAAFLQWEQTFIDRLDLIFGLRYDVYHIDEGDTETKLSPKVNAAFTVVDGLTLRTAFGQGFRVPSLAERFVNDQAFLPLIRNLDLRPEESTSYEIGLRSQAPLPLGFVAQTDAALFWNTYQNLVEPTFVTSEQAFQFVNLTEARIRGFESALDIVSANQRWRLRAGYTFLDADDLTDDRPLVFRSRHLLITALTVPLYGPFEVGLDYRFASAPERVDSDFARFVRDAEIVGDTRVLDARLAARWRHVEVAVLLKNALEYYYVERPAILAPPRHAIVQLHLNF